jgi:hypothetical protein
VTKVLLIKRLIYPLREMVGLLSPTFLRRAWGRSPPPVHGRTGFSGSLDETPRGVQSEPCEIAQARVPGSFGPHRVSRHLWLYQGTSCVKGGKPKVPRYPSDFITFLASHCVALPPGSTRVPSWPHTACLVPSPPSVGRSTMEMFGLLKTGRLSELRRLLREEPALVDSKDDRGTSLLIEVTMGAASQESGGWVHSSFAMDQGRAPGQAEAL